MFPEADWLEPEQVTEEKAINPSRLLRRSTPAGVDPAVWAAILRLVRRAHDEQTDMHPRLRDPGAPKTRGECVDGPRPCKWFACRKHLWAIQGEERPGRRHGEADTRHAIVRQGTGESCALDVVDKNPDGIGAEDLDGHMGMTAERVRQIEEFGRATLRAELQGDHHDTGDCLDGCGWCAYYERLLRYGHGQ